ncbi:MAG: hypothetical protein NZ601_00740, partial [candidate division WOR-3 bacterium]|nr:hypothetical protein [candidate division WOR-3 bacterium]
MSSKKLLLTILFIGLVSAVFAKVTVKDMGVMVPQMYVPERPFTMDTMTIRNQFPAGYNTGTLRDIAVGVGLKGPNDDTVRFFIANSASPRRQLLYTDTSTAGPIFRTAWRTELIESSGVGFHAAAIGDANNDGIPEIIFGRSATPFRLKRAQWTGSGWSLDTIATVTAAIWDIAIGDPNNDGLNEVYFTNGSALMMCRWNNVSGTWDTVRIWNGNGSTLYGVAIGDVDPTKPGKELYGCTFGQTLVQFHATGGGAFNYTRIDSVPVDVDFYDIAVGNYDPSTSWDEIAINNGWAFATYGNIFLYRCYGSTWTLNRFALYTAWSTLGEINIGGPVFDFYNGQVIIATPGGTNGRIQAL